MIHMIKAKLLETKTFKIVLVYFELKTKLNKFIHFPFFNIIIMLNIIMSL